MREETRKAQPMPPDLQPVTLHDSRAGWKTTFNAKEITAACNRWLMKNDASFAKSRRKKFGQI